MMDRAVPVPEGLTTLAGERVLATAATADDQEGHLTFGFLAEPVPGFSWVRALFEKEADPAAHDLFRRTQRALKDSLFDGIDFIVIAIGVVMAGASSLITLNKYTKV